MRAEVGLQFWLTNWNWQPAIPITTVIVIGLYLYAVGPLREHFFPQERFSMGKAVSFLLGVNIIFLALFSPLHELGDEYLFSAHMVQHLLLSIVGPPLIIAGIPAWLVRPVLRVPVLFSVLRFLTLPFVAFAIYNITFWTWHAPPIYSAALQDERLHMLEHVTFIGTSLLYWWPVFSPLQVGLPRLRPGFQLLYVFLSGLPTVALGAGLTFSEPLYTPYIYAPRVWNLSPAMDQQLGALLMWVPANVAYIIVTGVFFIRWMIKQEDRQRAAEMEWYADEEQDEREQMSETASTQKQRPTTDHQLS